MIQEYAVQMEEGDLVRLKSGGAVMVIDSVEADEAECVWLKGSKQISGKFSLDLLAPYPSVDLRDVSRPYFE